MERQPRRPTILERTAQMLELPADVIAGLSRLELIGDHELRIEQHKGILVYSREEIQVSTGKFIIKIMGNDLELRAMTGLELLITGQIRSIYLV